MPARKSYRRPRRRPRRRRKYRIARTPKGPLPVTLRTKLRYAEQLSLQNGVGQAATHVFSCNGLYDPDITGVGHQPRGFDQIMPLYNHYTVIGAKITVQFANHSVSTTPALVNICCLDNNVTTLVTNEYLENQRNVSKPLAINDSCTVSYKVSPAKFIGRSKIMADSQMKGDVGANPVEGCFFHVWACSAYGASAIDIDANVVIDYIAVFTEPNQPNQS